ncbi:MAG: DUF6352 family protein [Hyphomicrobiaceae bacterium]
MPERDGHEFWKSSGFHLLERDARGWLTVSPAFIYAYLTRPEVHPVEESCAAERALHAELIEDPRLDVPHARIAALADPDAREAYEIVLGFRDLLLRAGTIERAYLDLVQSGDVRVPPVFLDQMVHVIARNMLDKCGDPVRVRAAELLFRPQKVSTADQRLMLADEEILSMQAQMGRTGLGQLLAETGTPLRDVTLDVLDETNGRNYWARSDRFDMVIDFRFEQPALDALARVIEMWLAHLLGIDARVEPRPKIEDRDWRWHIGLDAQATRLLNLLYQGETLTDEDALRIVGLFRMTILDDSMVVDRVKGRPIYLGLAMDEQSIVRMKPQNLLTNLPLVRAN